MRRSGFDSPTRLPVWPGPLPIASAGCGLIHLSKQPIEQARHHHSSSRVTSNSKPSTRATASRDEAGMTWLYVFIVTLICECPRISITADEARAPPPLPNRA